MHNLSLKQKPSNCKLDKVYFRNSDKEGKPKAILMISIAYLGTSFYHISIAEIPDK